MTAHRLALLKKEQERTRWLNSPNSYQKIEILETGTDRPKRITKVTFIPLTHRHIYFQWIQDYSNPESSKSTPVKIHTAHQFSPFGTDPREFKQKQRKLKEERISGTIGAGPRSQVLDSLTHEDVAFLKVMTDLLFNFKNINAHRGLSNIFRTNFFTKLHISDYDMSFKLTKTFKNDI